MQLSEEQYYELIDEVQEGSPELSIGPLSSPPADVPSKWGEVLTARDPRRAIAELWRPVADRLPRIYRALVERLQGAGLLRTDDVPASLVYFFSGGEGVIPFRGRPPIAEAAIEGAQFPENFLDFYRIHDGWVHYYSEDRGPLPMASWSSLSNLWADVTWALPPGEISTEAAIAVYRDSDELALAYDTARPSALPLRCWGEGTVDVLLDMWAAIDTEMGAFLEQLDFAGNSSGRMARPLLDVGREAVARYERLLALLPERRALAVHFGGGSIHDQACDLLLDCALLERHGEHEREKLVEYYRHALQHRCAGLDLGSEMDPSEAVDWFGVALALDDPATAHFIASLPISVWADDSPESLQTRALFHLYLGDVEYAIPFVDELLGLTFDGDEPPDVEAEITAGLLEALSQRNAAAYGKWRQRAVDELNNNHASRRALIPWSFRLGGFDAVAKQLGLVRP